MSNQNLILKKSILSTPLGDMVALADSKELYFLAFANLPDTNYRIERLLKKVSATAVLGNTQPLTSIKNELDCYFKNELQSFITPLKLIGSPFQQHVWHTLTKIPYGITLSYAKLAQAIGRPSAFRAVAMANKTNNIAIVIPCHRIINANGNLGGYAGGINRKSYLIKKEKHDFNESISIFSSIVRTKY